MYGYVWIWLRYVVGMMVGVRKGAVVTRTGLKEKGIFSVTFTFENDQSSAIFNLKCFNAFTL